MGLASALNTSLTGLAAAEATFDVVGNNLANSNTVGFKASQAVFATQFLQTQSLGSAPTDNRGGTNPRQFGLGVNVAAVTPSFTQGTIEISNNPSDLAIQGDGFFIVQGGQGEQRYTRSGIFQTNAQNELVTITGHRLLGHVADENFEIQTTTLQPISIPLGSTTVAHATENVFLEGTLSPTGDIADTPEIIQSAVLSDGTVEVPNDLDPTDITALSPPLTQASSTVGLDGTPPAVGAVTVTPSTAAGTLAAGDYTYKIVYVDADGNEGIPSAATAVATVTLPDNTVTVDNIPLPTGDFVGTRVYRSTGAGGAGPYARIGADLGPFVSTFVDTGFAGGTTLDEGTGLPASPPGPAAYNYKIVYVDADGNEGPAETIPGVVDAAAGERKAHLTDLPTAAAPFVAKRIYRSSTVASGQPDGPYLLVSGDLPVGQTTFTDSGIVGSGTLDQQTLAPGNYGYYVTFVDSASGLETRPTSLIGPQPVNLPGRKVRLQNLPQPDGTGIFDRIKIYRSLSNDDTSFYEVADLPAGATVYVDNSTDAQLLASGNEINLDGPPINPSLALVDLVNRNGSVYNNVFEEGTLSFSAHKGGQSLATKELQVTTSTTVQELITFMEQALGIVKTSPDPANPIPGNPGGRITGESRIEVTGNNGEANAIDIRLSAFELSTATGVRTVNLTFGSTQEAVGESAATDFVVYDSLGIPLNVRLTTVLEDRDGTSTTYRWFADAKQNDPTNGVGISVGTGLVKFDGEGNIIDVTNSTVSIDRSHIASQSPLEFDLDFSSVSGLSVAKSEIAVASQDGSGTGVLTSFIVGEDGRIRGIFSNGVSRDLAQIRLARFANNVGLEQLGENLYAAGVNSGLPIEADPGAQGLGTILAGSVELSNTDIGKNLIDLIVASTQYRGSARVITATQQLLDELLNLRR